MARGGGGAGQRWEVHLAPTDRPHARCRPSAFCVRVPDMSKRKSGELSPSYLHPLSVPLIRDTTYNILFRDKSDVKRTIQTFRYAVQLLKHMDPPSESMFECCANAGFRADEKPSSRQLYVQRELDDFSRDRLENCVGWGSMVALFCVIGLALQSFEYHDFYAIAMKQEEERNELIEVYLRLDKEILDTFLFKRCVEKFFEAFKSGDASMCLRMRTALPLLSKMESREQADERRAREVILDELQDQQVA